MTASTQEMADMRTYNVVILGIGFLFIFTAFTTCGNIEQTVVKSLDNATFTGSGYHSLGIIYGVFSLANLLALTVVPVLGPRFTMFFSGILYSGYIAVFITPSTWSFYFTSVLIGIGAALLWTAQGYFLLENSDVTTINRNTGIFWALLQCSMLFGNLYVYLGWKGKTEISDQDRKVMFIALLVTSVLGTLSFLILRKSPLLEEEVLPEEEGRPLLYKQRATSAIMEAKKDFSLELSFCSGVYGTCIGATTHFGDEAKALIGISGIVVGFGEIVGGGLFGLVLKNSRFRRTSVVFLGMVVHFVAFYLIFLSIPDDAPVVFHTSPLHTPYMSPSVFIAMLCSFLLGLGDSCFNTQLYSILGCIYMDQSAPAFAIFKFVQSIFAAMAFFYSGYVLLSWQLLVMVVLGFTGTLCFFVVEKAQNTLAESHSEHYSGSCAQSQRGVGL
ncbi:UNC93-like protein MFSD11 isoform X5 [Electrophorus electricus]|uniref:UNC93-like protein MFSD11 isoform X5 n=1 Tax=Electrophorus electricus TaxID=8005 RepID=UPI0015D06396|nr:UNC93-like protein MFSD11 isoform X5 [Electrophorus electricus]